MSGPRVVYKQHAATPQSEITALAAIYRYLLFERSSARQKALEQAPSLTAATMGTLHRSKGVRMT